MNRSRSRSGGSSSGVVHPDPSSVFSSGVPVGARAPSPSPPAAGSTPGLEFSEQEQKEDDAAFSVQDQDEDESTDTVPGILSDSAKLADERRRSHRFLRMVLLDQRSRDDMEEHLFRSVSKQMTCVLGMYAAVVDFEEALASQAPDAARVLAARAATRYARRKAPLLVLGLSDNTRERLVAWAASARSPLEDAASAFAAAREELLTLIEADEACVRWLAMAVTRLRNDPARLLLSADRRADVLRVAAVYRLNVDAIKFYHAICECEAERDSRKAVLKAVELIASYVAPTTSAAYLAADTKSGLLEQCQDTRRVHKRTKKLFVVAKAEVAKAVGADGILLSLCDDEHRARMERIVDPTAPPPVRRSLYPSVGAN